MAEKYRRQFKNYLLDANFQIKYAFYFAASGVAVMGLLFVLMTRRINEVLDGLGVVSGNDLGPLEASLSGLVYDISIYTLIAFLLNVIFSFMFAIYMTHRIAGPAYVIEKYIREIQAGNYDSGRTLRKSDDLQSVMVALRDLAATLKAGKR